MDERTTYGKVIARRLGAVNHCKKVLPQVIENIAQPAARDRVCSYPRCKVLSRGGAYCGGWGVEIICQARALFFSLVFTRVVHSSHILSQEAHSA
jgi:hypothetical protein